MIESDREQQIALEVFGNYAEQICQYVDILTTRGIEWGLLGPREGSRIWGRHILNSVAHYQLFTDNALVCDVGSGAGLPGIPLAILRPDLEIVLVESLERRVKFLNLAVEELDLKDRVHVIRTRAEDDDGVYDFVTCRAVANLGKLIPWVTPLFYPNGQLLALKGSSAADEIEAADQVISQYGLAADLLTVKAHDEAEATQIIRLRKG